MFIPFKARLLALTAAVALVGAAAPALAQTSSPEMATQSPPPPFPRPTMAPPTRPAADNQAVLDAMAQLGTKPIETSTPADARKAPSFADGVKAVMRARGMSDAPDPAVATTSASYGPAAEQVLRIYRPASAPADARLPLVVYYHGGGWVIADIDTYDATPRALAKALNAVVVSAEYRRAPEHKFPAQHDDANLAIDWAIKHAAEIGADARRLAVAGESAGGNLAVNAALHANRVGDARPRAVLAVYPIASSDPNLPSKRLYGAAKPLNTPALMWFGHYVTRSPADMRDRRWNLAGGELGGLPPVTIVNAEIDPLRDDGAALERSLKAAGVRVERRVFAGATHEFFGAATVIRAAADAQAFAVGRLQEALR